MNNKATSAPRVSHTDEHAVGTAYFGPKHDQRLKTALRPIETRSTERQVIMLLNNALAAEIICILRYKRHYFMTAGIRARHVKAKFLQHVTEEQAHADQLAERIIQLGGELDLAHEPLMNRYHTEYAEHVEGDSLEEIIMAGLIAERIEIESYRAMIVYIGADDPFTRQVLERILGQEEAHAENLAGLLRDCASK